MIEVNRKEVERYLGYHGVTTIDEEVSKRIDECIAELQEKERWTRHTGAEYPFYECEDRTLWQIVRDNPGLVLIKDGVIIRKWSQFAMPEFDYEHELNPETIEELPHPLRFSAKPIRFDD